ncbi:hypothetical protein [Streptomyces xanthophaeus]|uniref:Uncharacterized protein n=1 Tax=Streptomyces xanthophaeus TaxID=67385 RepID=A0A919GUM8_9ACTN|nr:hypothetical protein [Streptomyces xanthophaeus]GHI84134.1 hypothetical protein Sxan_14980 [Streptomyces xanthophaeus]
MSDTARIRPFANEPMGFGANVHDMRERSFQNAIQSYYNKDRLTTPQGMLSAPVANSRTGRGLFDGLNPADAPRRSFSDVC